MLGSQVLGVAAGDFTVNLLSAFMQKITSSFEYEEGFIVDVGSGLMVASSMGMSHVARPVHTNDTGGLVRYHWNQVPDPFKLVQAPMRALAMRFESFVVLEVFPRPFPKSIAPDPQQ